MPSPLCLPPKESLHQHLIFPPSQVCLNCLTERTFISSSYQASNNKMLIPKVWHLISLSFLFCSPFWRSKPHPVNTFHQSLQGEGWEKGLLTEDQISAAKHLYSESHMPLISTPQNSAFHHQLILNKHLGHWANREWTGAFADRKKRINNLCGQE